MKLRAQAFRSVRASPQRNVCFLDSPRSLLVQLRLIGMLSVPGNIIFDIRIASFLKVQVGMGATGSPPNATLMAKPLYSIITY